MNTSPSDQAVREAVLDPSDSFIVQAPAGSGKTELLTQRFLTLLGCVDSPEEIIAITFTRKAAQEMRHRIMHALQQANAGTLPKESHKQITYHLGKQALQQNQQHDWRLLDNPSRLRILTLDALSAMIDQQSPIATAFGAKPEVIDDAAELYEKAVYQLLMDTSNETVVDAVNSLLLYCQNNIPLLTRLLSHLLATREQWLAHVMPYFRDSEAMQQHLESALLVDERLLIEAINHSLPDAVTAELRTMIQLASQQLMASDTNSAIVSAAQQQSSEQSLPFWLAVSELMLTKQGHFRKSLTKKQGFPSPSSASGELKASLSDNKKRMQALLNACSHDAQLNALLRSVTVFPKKQYDPTHWEQLHSLTQLLPYLVAQLNVCFQATGKVDFNELTIGAIRALFHHNEPTYLALQLDHQIKHLLVDECQDTSNLQHELLTRLVDGWSPDDGRTLFLVGDPMQSIYRFRNANVSHFLHIQNTGINRVTPTPKQLTRNFRSTPAVIQWINHAFSSIFSPHNDPNAGAIAYAPSMAVKADASGTQGVHHYPIDASAPSLEANCIKQVITRLQAEAPQASIAILVRARHQLQALLPTLTEAGIPFHANKLHALSSNPDVQDLMTLTRALSHLNDRVAWLALLKSPLFAFELSDLCALTQDAAKPLITQLLDDTLIQQLSSPTQARLQRLLPALRQVLHHAKRLPLHDYIRKAWYALGGPITLTNSTQHQHVDRFFQELTRFDDITDLDAFISHFSELYAEDTCQQAALSVMTIHQSKGLEFDHVILPGLQRSNPRSDQPMLRWSSLHDHAHQEHLLLACRTHQATDGLYDYLAHRDKQQTQHELARLFYVACTRAKHSLHLTYQTDTPQDSDATLEKARSGSFLSLLGEDGWSHAHCHLQETSDAVYASQELPIHQVSVNSECLDQYLSQVTANKRTEESPVFEPIDRIAQAKGNALHAWLAHRVESPSADDNELAWLTAYLRQAGINQQQRTNLAQHITQIYHQMTADPIGAWLLDPSHACSETEYALSLSGKERRQTLIIDRWFIDDNTCWIVDYKTSEQVPTTPEEALERHRHQLLRYASALSQLREEPIRIGVYYTEQQRWYHWAYSAITSNSIAKD